MIPLNYYPSSPSEFGFVMENVDCTWSLRALSRKEGARTGPPKGSSRRSVPWFGIKSRIYTKCGAAQVMFGHQPPQAWLHGYYFFGNQIEFGVMFTNLAIFWGPHFVVIKSPIGDFRRISSDYTIED